MTSKKSHIAMFTMAGGLLLGILCLAQASGKLIWMPEGLFFALHMPALGLSGLFFQGERALLGMPVAILAQWLLLGWLVGFIIARIRKSNKAPSPD